MGDILKRPFSLLSKSNKQPNKDEVENLRSFVHWCTLSVHIYSNRYQLA